MFFKFFNSSNLSLSAEYFGTLVEFDRSTFTVEVLLHFTVSEVLFTSLASEFYIVESLEREPVYFLNWNIFVATVGTIF